MKDANELDGTIKTLYDAIIEHLGLDNEEEAQGIMLQAASHGASGGYPGFTYYHDTAKFHDENEDAIWNLLEEHRESTGEHDNILAFIASFNEADNVGSMAQLKNLLTWFALEEVGHALESTSRIRENPRRGGFTTTWWKVYLHGKMIDKVQYHGHVTAESVKRGLVEHDGYDPGIRVVMERKGAGRPARQRRS